MWQEFSEGIFGYVLTVDYEHLQGGWFCCEKLDLKSDQSQGSGLNQIRETNAKSCHHCQMLHLDKHAVDDDSWFRVVDGGVDDD